MKRTLMTAAAAALAFIPAIATDYQAPAKPKKGEDTKKPAYVFKDVKVLKTTPVKDQNKSGTCWSFAGTGLLENEIMRKGGPELDLSEMFVVRNCYIEKAQRFMRNGGISNFAQGGANADVPYVYEKYGALPEEAYPGLNYGEKKHDHYEMFAAMDGYLRGVLKGGKKSRTTAWLPGFIGILDAYLGPVPEKFTYNGKEYTPKSFAQEMGLKNNDYINITSYTHHPYYEEFAVEIPDNWLNLPSQNVPMEEMKQIVDNALENGYSVAWAADVSEGGFKWRDGYAVIPAEKNEADMDGTELSRWVKLSDNDREKARFDIKEPVKEVTVTQEMRQKHFDNLQTTDDHGMLIVGYATDQKGTRYYKVKNSWDTNQVYDGYFYVSEPYFLDKTISVMVNKEAVPAEISGKFRK